MDVEIEKPRVHHRATGHRRLDWVLPIAALFVSFVSIGIAYHHGHIMSEVVEQNERLVQANSFPRLSSALTLTNTNNLPEVRRTLSNDGVGPAEIRFARLSLDGRTMGSYEQLLRECCGLEQSSNSSLTGSMLRQGAKVDYLTIQATPATRDGVQRLIDASLADRIEATVCYCSVFDECWVLNTSADRPAPIELCPAAPRRGQRGI